MVSKVQPGREALARMGVYRTISELGVLRTSYAGKFALAAFVGILIPLATFIVYLLLSRTDWEAMYPVLAALVLACFALVAYTVDLLLLDARANRLGAHTYEAYAEQNVGLTWTSSVAQPGSMLWRRRRDS